MRLLNAIFGIPDDKDNKPSEEYPEKDARNANDDAAGQNAPADEAAYRKLLAAEPNNAGAWINLGNIYKARGNPRDAIAHYKNALRIEKNNPLVYNNMGAALFALGSIDDAIACYRRAIALKPDFADPQNNLGNAFRSLGGIDDAIAHYEKAIAIDPQHAAALNNLGNVLKELGRYGEAAGHYERAIAIRPDYADAHYNMANLLMELGRLDDAVGHYDRAIAVRPDHAEAHFNRSGIKTFRQEDPDLAILEALAGNEEPPEGKPPHIHFALAKAYEDCGDTVRAFERLRQGNTLKRNQIEYDEAAETRRFGDIASVFDRPLLERLQGAGDSSAVPVFVLGMPRSGSTLVEQILASHPQVHGAGELAVVDREIISMLNARDLSVPYPACVPDLEKADLRLLGQSYLGHLDIPAGKTRVVDKMPGNFFNIGLIRLMLPNAKIIHTMRDPADTCASCYSRLFTDGHEYTYDLGELGRFYRHYAGLMGHWRSVLPPGAMLEVSYEDLVANLEGLARRLVEYCGLPWDGRCLDFHKTGRPVRTASNVQVRQPLFRTSLQRWRKYEDGLTPLLDELRDIMPVQ